MVEHTKPHAEPAHKEHVEPKPVPAKLASAAASGDGAVQHLLAERQTHVMNSDMDKADQVDKALAELGYA